MPFGIIFGVSMSIEAFGTNVGFLEPTEAFGPFWAFWNQ